MIHAEQEVLEIYRAENAIWSFDYNGDPQAPHAKWTGGRCADGYTNSRLVLSHPDYAAELASMLIAKARTSPAWRDPDWVVGSAYAAIAFSYEVARQLSARHGFTRKSPSDPKKMVWDQLVIPRAATVLQCEELIATFSTTTKVRQAIISGNPTPVRFLPRILTIITYTQSVPLGMGNLISLATRDDIRTWLPENCPMCQRCSPRVRPAENWELLTGKKK